jgi:hypothetical protein
MGRRSRKRAASPVAPPARPAQAPASRPAATPPRAATYKSRREDAPQPAWAPFPLTELVILIAIVLFALGLFSHGDRRGVMLAGGMVLITLSAGELSLREHFAGYRSHSALLAAICAILAAIPVWLLPVPQEVVLVVGLVVFAFAFMALRNAFRRRSGGVGFRV